MLATKIKMEYGCYKSKSLDEIDQIYIEGGILWGYYKKGFIHDFLQTQPGSIQVNIKPFQDLIPGISSRGEKYVRSSPNGYTHDDLLDLPRE